MTARRHSSGGAWIDRSRPVSFRFDGRELEAFEGDTLASALLANGIVGGFRSPIIGRPRGIVSAGSEEPNAFVAVLEPRTDVIVPATTVPMADGLVAESRPGVARLADGSANGTARRRHHHVETLVVGAGAAGRAAASEAAGRGDRVLLGDERHVIDDSPSEDDVTVLPNATALGVYDAGYVVIHERAGDAERVWHVRAGHVVLATGAHERPIAFAGNDLPGVMLAGSVAAYVERFGVAPAERAAVFATNGWGLEVADVLAGAGVEVVRTIDARTGERVVAAQGDGALERIVVRIGDGSEEDLDVDLLAVSGGWNPNLALWRAIGGGLTYDAARSCFVPGGGPSWLSVAGAAAGAVPESFPLWFVEEGEDAEKFVDLQRDQTVADVAAALGRGLRSVEHVKRATYIGTAVDQGRTSGVLAAEVVNHLLGEGAGAQGPSGARPPYTPVSFATLAGPFAGDRFDPVRTTPMHARHVEQGAVFEDTGQWKRPRFFAPDGEPMEDAVERECLAVRNAVGAMDASTLGKIEVVGPDAPAFLDRMYTNRMSNLAIGAIRYGVMLGLDGMVWDDGVAMRVAEDRYYVTTTTGGAANVLDRFEEWLQTEWPELRVYCTSVTEQRAVVAMNGPKARDVLAAAGTDVDLSRESFPFMTFRDGTLAGVPARLARVSFSGELAYELHVSSWHGLAVWEAVLAAGEPFGIRPYGLEAMDVLRAEKGFFIVGQETDGTVTPFDLGMDWIVNPSKGDFLGRRSLRRSDLVRPDRKQLVGLLPEDPTALLPEGAQLVLEDTGRIPMPMSGHVTSSYRSPALDRTFALGLLEGGHGMHGRTVYAPLPDRTIAATVAPPVFYDPRGERRDG
ncbi:MAG TPA: 2Fe-2S iron-sulfur cluster-binding protein [Actinomycetota bacterium]|nr:2Fe-2S iron-sulfur cluster-binding protein [Actinomycetota bacterium]